MKDAQTIDEVIARLDDIIADCKKRESRMGYFAAMYRRTTVAVQTCIAQNQFEDGARMEHLDVIFANRYLQAWDAYNKKQPCTNSWCKTFDSAASTNLIVMQHLILGMNAHINLDLGIAAAQTCPGNAIWDLQNDFEKINNVIADTSQHVQQALTEIWFPLRFIKSLTNKREDAVLNFSVTAARKASWANGTALALVQGQAHDNYIAQIDKRVVEIAQRIIAPGFVMGFILKPVLLMESKRVSGLIDILNR